MGEHTFSSCWKELGCCVMAVLVLMLLMAVVLR